MSEGWSVTVSFCSEWLKGAFPAVKKGKKGKRGVEGEGEGGSGTGLRIVSGGTTPRSTGALPSRGGGRIIRKEPRCMRSVAVGRPPITILVSTYVTYLNN